MTEIKFGRALIGFAKETFFDSFTVLSRGQLVFEQQFAFE